MCLFCDNADVCDVCATCEHCDGKTFDVDKTYCDRCVEEFTCSDCGDLNFDGDHQDGDYYCEDCFNNNFRICEQCCDVIGNDASVLVGDEIYCEDCASEYCCYDCGGYHKDGDEYDHDYYCRRCFDENFTICDDCSDTVRCDEITYVDGNYICEGCLSENYFYCEGCDRYYNLDDYGGDSFCVDCMHETCGPGCPIVGTTTNRTGSNRCFGVEIETYSGEYESRPDEWGCVEDGSIIGMELVSPIMSGDAGLESIEELYRDVEPTFCERCGTHVHVDIRDLTKAERFEVIKAFDKSKTLWFSKVDPARWENSYCDGDMKSTDGHDDYDGYMRSMGFARYNWCNLQSISKHGTIEIRLLEATENVDKVTRWVIELIQFVDKVVATHRELMTA